MEEKLPSDNTTAQTIQQKAKKKTKSPETGPNPTNPPRKLNILLHNGNALRMDGTQIRVLEQMHHERLRRFLQRLNRMRLPPQLGANFGGQEIERDFTDKPRKGQFGDQQVVGALVPADFFEGHGAGLIAPASALGGRVAGFIVDVRKWIRSRGVRKGRRECVWMWDGCIRWTLEGRFPAGRLPAFTADLRAFAGEVVAEEGRATARGWLPEAGTLRASLGGIVGLRCCAEQEGNGGVVVVDDGQLE